MTFSVILSGKNVVQDGYNSTYQYLFPTGQIRFDQHEIAVGSVNMYYSWYNITSLLQNNVFQYKWLGVDVDVTVPDGNYSLVELNQYLQFKCIQQTHYLVDGSGNYVYFMEILPNPTKNLVELVLYPLPSSMPVGYSYPIGATWTLPVAPETPQFVFPTNFASLLGFVAGTYPDPVSSSVYNVLGSSVDRLYPVTSLLMSCSLVKNSLSVPSTQLYSFPVAGYDFGELIQSSPSFYSYVPIQDGIYTELFIRFFDQDGNRIHLRDTDLVIYLVIKKRQEMLA